MARICCTGSGGVAFACSDLNGCSVDSLQDVDTTSVPPVAGQFLGWDGANWVPSPGAGGDTSVVTPSILSGLWTHDDGNGSLTTIRSTSLTAGNTIAVDPINGGSFLELQAGAGIAFAGTGASGSPLIISAGAGGGGAVLVGNCLIGDGTFGNELNIDIDIVAAINRLSCSANGALVIPEELHVEWSVSGLGGIALDSNAWRSNSAGSTTRLVLSYPDQQPNNPTSGNATIDIIQNNIIVFTVNWDFAANPLFRVVTMVLPFSSSDEFRIDITSVSGLGGGEEWRNPSFFMYYNIS